MTAAGGAAAIEVSSTPQGVRRPRRRRRRHLHRRDRGVLRHPRAQRRRQDHDARDDRGAATPRRRGGPAARASRAGRATRASCPGSACSCRPRRSSSGSPHVSRSDVRLALRRAASAGRRVAGAGRAHGEGLDAHREAVRRAAPAARDRVCPGARPRDRLPRRADRGDRSAGPAEPVGPAALAERGRPDGRADHALPGRGRVALRPRRDHGPRPDPAAGLAAGPGTRARRAGAHPRGPAPAAGRRRGARSRGVEAVESTTAPRWC